MNNPLHLRYFDSTLEELMARGHHVALTFTRGGLLAGDTLASEADLPRLYSEALEVLSGFARPPVNLGPPPKREDDFAQAAGGLRGALDYVRYLDPAYAGAEFLRTRAHSRALKRGPFARPFAALHRLRPWQLRLLMRGLLAAERAIPSSPKIEEFIRSSQPDVVLVSALVGGSSQTDYVKSAMALGIPTGVCISSWDNLTNKGHIKILPDRVIVWNDSQMAEAIELHGVPASRVAITGAQPFDRWFDRTPSASREEFCAKVGLRPDRPLVLFCGSSTNVAGEQVEEAFVRRWVQALRETSGHLPSDLGILVRPHPERSGSWAGLLDDDPHAVVWPPAIHYSISPGTRSDYFDSMYHAEAVVGINTSAMIEAAVVGRPVLTVRSPEFSEAQDGTLHFRYLRPEHGGFIRETQTLEDHVADLADAIADPGPPREANARFVRRFIRPHGLERRCTPILADVIEQLAATRASYPQAAARGTQVGMRLVARSVAFADRQRKPKAVLRRAERATGVLETLANRADARHGRVAAIIRLLAGQLEAKARRKATKLRRKKDVRLKRRRSVEQRGARLLDPD